MVNIIVILVIAAHIIALLLAILFFSGSVIDRIKRMHGLK